MGNFDNYWEMKQYTGKHSEPVEVFKCTKCNAVTHHPDGFNGEPNTHKCSDKCQCSKGDWKIGNANKSFRENFDSIFPDSPGAGI